MLAANLALQLEKTNASPVSCTRTSGAKIVVEGMCSAAEARIIGPVQGRKLTPAPIEAAHAKIRLSMPRRS